MIPRKKIPEIIKTIRDKKKLTFREIAKIFDVSPAAVHHWEHKRNLPDFETFLIILNKLETDSRLQINPSPPIFPLQPSPPVEINAPSK